MTVFIERGWPPNRQGACRNILQWDFFPLSDLLVLHQFAGGPPRFEKCHGYDGYIHGGILAGWGESLEEHAILQKHACFGEDAYIV